MPKGQHFTKGSDWRKLVSNSPSLFLFIEDYVQLRESKKSMIEEH